MQARISHHQRLLWEACQRERSCTYRLLQHDLPPLWKIVFGSIANNYLRLLFLFFLLTTVFFHTFRAPFSLYGCGTQFILHLFYTDMVLPTWEGKLSEKPPINVDYDHPHFIFHQCFFQKREKCSFWHLEFYRCAWPFVPVLQLPSFSSSCHIPHENQQSSLPPHTKSLHKTNCKR